MKLSDYTSKGLREVAGELGRAKVIMVRRRNDAMIALAAAEAEAVDWDKIISATDAVIESMIAEANHKDEPPKEPEPTPEPQPPAPTEPGAAALQVPA
ncbi:MAG TPA: hypothetical protein VNT29_09180 [Candidatus Limnocylindrales bacterium]|nr:hypothetical protein [Candidatus Limnocylindrales bacterium]